MECCGVLPLVSCFVKLYRCNEYPPATTAAAAAAAAAALDGPASGAERFVGADKDGLTPVDAGGTALEDLRISGGVSGGIRPLEMDWRNSILFRLTR